MGVGRSLLSLGGETRCRRGSGRPFPVFPFPPAAADGEGDRVGLGRSLVAELRSGLITLSVDRLDFNFLCNFLFSRVNLSFLAVKARNCSSTRKDMSLIF